METETQGFQWYWSIILNFHPCCIQLPVVKTLITAMSYVQYDEHL